MNTVITLQPHYHIIPEQQFNMSVIKNVVVTGASGNLGTVIFEKLAASGKYNIKVLRREGSNSTFPTGTNVVDVDFSSLESLKAALKGQDAIVSVAASAAIDSQRTLVDAAIATGVKRFLPSEFGSNLDNPETRTLPVYGTKVAIQDYLIEQSKTTSLSYTFVYNGAFLDWGLQNAFLLDHSEFKPTIIDDGEALTSSTTTGSIGDAVVGVLSHPEETKNRSVYVEDIKVSQNQLVALAKEIAPGKPWDPQHVKLSDMITKGKERLSKGLIDFEALMPFLMKAVFDPACGGNFTKTDNELLGVKGKTEEDIREIFRGIFN